VRPSRPQGDVAAARRSGRKGDRANQPAHGALRTARFRRDRLRRSRDPRTLAPRAGLPRDMASIRWPVGGAAVIVAGSLPCWSGPFAVVIILVIAFRSWTDGCSPCGTASLAGITALHVAGSTLNISSFVGAIMKRRDRGRERSTSHSQSTGASGSGVCRGAASPPHAARAPDPHDFHRGGIAFAAALALASAGSVLSPLAQSVVGGFLGRHPLLIVLPAPWRARAASSDGLGVRHAHPQTGQPSTCRLTPALPGNKAQVGPRRASRARGSFPSARPSTSWSMTSCRTATASCVARSASTD
jgi:hypothetical protein